MTILNQICLHLLHSSRFLFFPQTLLIICYFNISQFHNYFHVKDNSQSNLSTFSPFFQSLLGPFSLCVISTSRNLFHSNRIILNHVCLHHLPFPIFTQTLSIMCSFNISSLYNPFHSNGKSESNWPNHHNFHFPSSQSKDLLRAPHSFLFLP